MPGNARIVTTVGRIIFSEILANGMPFYNTTLGKKGCSRVIDDTYQRQGRPATINLLDAMKELGFKTSTVSGLSIAITDLRIPGAKQQLIDETQQKVNRVEKNFDAGAITERERHNQLLKVVLGSPMESRKSDHKLKPLPPDPFHHQDSAIALGSLT